MKYILPIAVIAGAALLFYFLYYKKQSKPEKESTLERTKRERAGELKQLQALSSDALRVDFMVKEWGLDASQAMQVLIKYKEGWLLK